MSGTLAHDIHLLPCPFSSRSFVTGAIRLVQMRNVRNQWIVGVGIGQHRTDREKDYRYRQYIGLRFGAAG
jgi:hypothetical protein